jgi:hypothetical protein
LEVMLVYARWYAGYPLSLRHPEETMHERDAAFELIENIRKLSVAIEWYGSQAGRAALPVPVLCGADDYGEYDCGRWQCCFAGQHALRNGLT